jgi:hypothetical protein
MYGISSMSRIELVSEVEVNLICIIRPEMTSALYNTNHSVTMFLLEPNINHTVSKSSTQWKEIKKKLVNKNIQHNRNTIFERLITIM